MESFDSLSSEEIAKRVAVGDKVLYELIVRRFNPVLYKIGRSFNFNHDDTMDLMQETFISAYLNLDTFEGRSSLKTWLIRIMMNHCLRKQEKFSYKNETAEDLNEDAVPMYANTQNDTYKVVHNKELAQIIEQSLAHIPYDYRLVFSLREINGMSVSETAELMDISEANVKVRLNRSKKMLQNLLIKSYSPNELFDFNLIYCDEMVGRVMSKVNLM